MGQAFVHLPQPVHRSGAAARWSAGHRARFLEILEGVREFEAWGGKRVALVVKGGSRQLSRVRRRG